MQSSSVKTSRDLDSIIEMLVHENNIAGKTQGRASLNDLETEYDSDSKDLKQKVSSHTALDLNTAGDNSESEQDSMSLIEMLSKLGESSEVNQEALLENEQIQALIREQIATQQSTDPSSGNDTNFGDELADLAQSTIQSFGTEMAGELLGSMFGHGDLEQDIDSAMKFFNDPDADKTLLDNIDLSAIGGAAANALLGMATQKLWSSVWSLNKDASAGEVAAYGIASKYLQGELASQVLSSVGLSESGTGPLSKLLGLSESTDQWPALTVGHADESANTITAGAPTVLVEGKMMSRMGDKVDKAGDKIYLGSDSVIAGGQSAALAKGKKPGSVSAPMDEFLVGASTVFVGGKVVGSLPPVSAGVGGAAATGAASVAMSNVSDSESESNASGKDQENFKSFKDNGDLEEKLSSKNSAREDDQSASEKLKTPKGESRPLSVGEKAMAEVLFGNSIDYDVVRVHNGEYLWFGLQFNDTAMAPNGEIYFNPKHFSEDFSQESERDQSWFMHEMAHVWQSQNEYPVKHVGLVNALFKWLPGFAAHEYNYELIRTKKLSDLDMEAQAQMLSHYWHHVYTSPSYKQNQSNFEVIKVMFEKVLKDFIENPSNKENLPS